MGSSSVHDNVQFHSFSWAGSFRGDNPLRETVANPLNESRLRAAIAAHFPTGVEPARNNADCLVGYGIGSYAVTDWAYPNGWSYSWGLGPYEGPYVYDEGVIAVDLYGAMSRQPLWHASVEQNLNDVGWRESGKQDRDCGCGNLQQISLCGLSRARRGLVRARRRLSRRNASA